MNEEDIAGLKKEDMPVLNNAEHKTPTILTKTRNVPKPPETT